MVSSPGAEVSKRLDRSAELKRRPQMWEAREVLDFVGRILGQQHTGQQNAEKKNATADR